MKCFFKSALPALALLASVSVAQAANGPGAGMFDGNVNGGWGATPVLDVPGANIASGSFYGYVDQNNKIEDVFNFTLQSSYKDPLIDIAAYGTSNLTGGTVGLYSRLGGAGSLVGGQSLNISNSGYDSLQLSGVMPSGSYSLVVSGAGTAGDLYGGTVNISAVPLPAALPMFGAGLVGLGALSRRRKNSKTNAV